MLPIRPVRVPARWRTFTVAFYVPDGGEVPSFERIDAFLTDVPGLMRYAPYTGMYYAYENRATGVKGAFRYDLSTQVASSEALEGAIPEEEAPEAAGWTAVPLQFTASLGVSSWWPRELMPLVVRACEGLGLVVLDHHLLLVAPHAAGVEELTSAWSVANRGVLPQLRETTKDPRFFMAPERMQAVWEYLRERPRLEAELASRGVRVPEVAFFPSGAEAASAVAWVAGEASVFPRVDRVCVKRVRRGFLGIGAEETSGWVAWETFAAALGSRLSTRPGEERWRLFDGRLDRALRRAIEALTLTPFAWQERIDPGLVVDEVVSEAAPSA